MSINGDRARRFSAKELLAALVLLFLVTPFIEDLKQGDLIEAVLITLVLLSALFAIGGRQRTVAVGVVLLTPALVGRWVNHFRPDLVPRWVFLGVGLVFICFVVVNLLWFVLRAPRVNSEVLCVGIATYLMLGLFWAFGYLLVAQLVPSSFAFTAGSASAQSLLGFNGLYFSFITLSTVGYGDIIPVSPAARMLAMTEGMTGTIYVAVLISRLVALYSAASSQVEPDKTNPDRRQP